MEQMEPRGEPGQMVDFPWWVFLITGIAWMIIAVIVLRFQADPVTSVSTVGFLIGSLFVFAAINEYVAANMVDTWKWLHWLMGSLFLLGALYGFIRPYDTFFALASVLGFLLVFMGTLEIIRATMSREVNPLWGLGLVNGILLLLLGIWASQRYYPASAVLILIWVGFMALFRGIGQIVLAFGIRRLIRG
jgi:uncharacterized membrane protein HdeD (DUF308 family)